MPNLLLLSMLRYDQYVRMSIVLETLQILHENVYVKFEKDCCNLKLVIFKLMWKTVILNSSCEIALM